MPDLQTAKQRIKQIFEYLKALNEHRNPSVRQIKEQPWSLWLDEFPRHAAIEFPQRVTRPPSETPEESGTEPAFLLRVRRPKLTTAPTPPDELRDWLLAGWDDPFRSADTIDARNVPDANGETVTVRFTDDPGRPAALAKWQQKRDAWKEAELPARAAMAGFDKLYALHGKMEREGERFDLVVGDGVLSWQQPEGSIYHPVLLQRVQLVFDPKKPEFLVVDADVGSELYTGLFQSISEVDPRVLRSRREEFEAGGYHPFDQESSGVLEGFVNQLSAQGTFIGQKRPSHGSPAPTIGRGPVLFLRSRTKGFGTAIQKVIETIEDRDEFCDAFHNIVGCGHRSDPQDGVQEPTPTRSPERPAHDVLFGKPANPEQLRIARALDRHGSVLVQGPPGTGKSHTIANLIGHLLANNQSVLVTSHTTKALRVLRNHLVEELRPLCVSVLESDLDSRQQLEQSVLAISRRLSESDGDSLEREAGWFVKERSQLIHDLESLQEQLKDARADEYREVIYGGKGISPAAAARIVAAGRGAHDWMPGPVALGEPCPLSMTEVQELYATNKSCRSEDDLLVDRALPDTGELPTPQDAARSFKQSGQLAENGQIDRRYWPNARFTTAHIAQLETVITELKSVHTEFAQFEGWKLAAIDAGRNRLSDGGPWTHLLSKIDEAIEFAKLTQTDSVLHGPEILDETSLASQHLAAGELLKHLSEGGKLGWTSLVFRASWKQALSNWRVQGRTPETAEQITAVQRLIAVKRSRADLRLLWDGLMTPHGGPQTTELGNEPERAAAQFALIIRNAFDWWAHKWGPLEQRLREIGFDWDRFIGERPPNLNRYGEMRRVMDAIRDSLVTELEKTKSHLQSLRLNKLTGEVLGRLRTFDRPEVESLRKAIEDKDEAAYADSYQACLSAADRRKHSLRRKELLAKMTRTGSGGLPLAEGWAESIRNRHALHGEAAVPGDVGKAWEWRQLNDELDRRAEVDLEALGRQIQKINDRLKQLTIDLIDRKAWAGQVRRTGSAQRQALMGWLSIITRIGRGFGRRVPQLRREAQQKMEECREAVPVWVMPLSRLVENFDFSEPRFDVVIIDEASQCDVMALMALAIARKVIVVGDDKQVSPTAVGQKVDIIDNLIRLHLDGIPNSVLYDGKMSIYDLAKQSFSGVICLLEHFRCVPDIIQFSNHLSYEGTIKPLREQASSPLTPNVVSYRVEGGLRGDEKVNRNEATAIASLIVAACEHPAYAGQTFGAISLVGDDQAIEIERLLLRHLKPDEYDRRRIVCGNSAQFQGDERHVMFLSVVDSPGDGPLRMSDRDETKQRYNVAASRAQNQTWVVHSLNYEVDLKPGDLRRRLIEHAIDPKAVTRELDQASARTESPFEQEVFERLIRQGYRVRPQWQVGRYRIDLVVEGLDGRVAVECDGDRFHPIEKLPEDMERQAILERLGWRFVRIRGSAFFRDRDSTMEKVFAKLDELKVFPAARDVQTEAIDESRKQDPVADVIRRAAELRAQWQDAESRGDASVDSVAVEEPDAVPNGQTTITEINTHFNVHVTEPSNAIESSSDLKQDVTDSTSEAEVNDAGSQDMTSVITAGTSDIVASQEDSAVKHVNAPRKFLFDELDEPVIAEASSLQERILQLITRQPGLKGREIASLLGVDKKEVNSILHRHLSSQLHQDEESRWWPRSTN